jgi:hypothetical protein
MTERLLPAVKVRHNVVCQSDRHGAAPQLIVIHDTEGANLPGIRDLAGLGNFFDNINTQASSHVATDEDGHSARYVPDARKAWTQVFYNSPGLSIEQIGFANQDWTAKRKQAQLEETARWIARWHRLHGIPIRKGAVTTDGRITRTGVLQHRDLGHLGGDHHDVSADYPLARVLRMARRYNRLYHEQDRESDDQDI